MWVILVVRKLAFSFLLSTPVTVTVCGRFQLDSVNVRAPLTVATLLFPLTGVTVTLAVGSALRTTV